MATQTFPSGQSLFEAIHEAALRAQEQANNLQRTMGEIKKLHTKMRNADLAGDSCSDRQHVRQIITAWQRTTSSFAAVFHELHEHNKSDDAMDCSEDNNHETIQRLYKSALAAKNTAHLFAPGLSMRTPSVSSLGKHATDTESDFVESRKQKIHRVDEPDSSLVGHGTKRGFTEEEDSARSPRPLKLRRVEVPSLRPKIKTRSKKNTKSRRSSNFSMQFPLHLLFSSSSGDDLNDVEMVDSGSEPAESDSTPSTPGGYIHIPPVFGVRYEDVTAEVEERLRMKELRRLDTKGDMKRKRPTDDIFNPKLFAAEQAQEQSQMPASKRTKKDPSPGSQRSQSRTIDQVSGFKRNTPDVTNHNTRSKKQKL